MKQYSVEYGEAGRQQIWLKAVSTIKGLDKIEGIHLEHHQKPRSEKMTDVNIAVELILDALDPNGYDQAVLISGDLDLIPAAVAVMSRIPQPREIDFWIPPNLNHKKKRVRLAR